MDSGNMKLPKLGVQRHRPEAVVPVLRQATRVKGELHAGCGIVELASSCLHTLCKRDGPMPLLRDSPLSPSGTSISCHDTGPVHCSFGQNVLQAFTLKPKGMVNVNDHPAA